MRIAIVHPWFLELGGAEKVLNTIAQMYPEADIYSFSADPAMLPEGISRTSIHVTKWSGIIARFRFRRSAFMILFPWISESIDVSGYDLVISSCPPVMGVNVGQDAVHVCYCHSPQRAWWSLYSQRQAAMRWPARQVFRTCAIALRMWEYCAMQRVDWVISNSNYISARVRKYFRRESTVIYPPVNTAAGYLVEKHDDYYLSVSRLDVDKGIELLIHACNRLRRRLVVVGSGRREIGLRSIAGPTIDFRGQVPDSELFDLYARCRAFLFAADEDFGIAPVEAQAFGRPVIAYGHGGSLETVRVNDPFGRSDTGVFFDSQTVECVIDGILRFEAQEHVFVPNEIRTHALQFDVAVFRQHLKIFIDRVSNEKSRALRPLVDCPDGL